MPFHLMLAITGTLFSLAACKSENAGQDEQPSAPAAPDTLSHRSTLGRYNLSEKNPKTFRVPGKMSEISGLAISPDGRIFAHDDEDAVVYELDKMSGEVLKRFTIGSGFMSEDFEGIAVKQDTFFLVTSSGDLFEFRETVDRGHADFRLHRTFLSQRNDVEGLEYDPLTDCLLLACKGSSGEGYEGFKAVYEFSLRDRTMKEKPRFLIPLERVKKKARKGNFNPSGIALHPSTDTFFIISADGGLVIEIDREGEILGQTEISRDANPQPEGIVFGPDGTMFLANDGQGEKGTVTVYPADPR